MGKMLGSLKSKRIAGDYTELEKDAKNFYEYNVGGFENVT